MQTTTHGPKFPIELVEVLARARTVSGLTPQERVWNTLTNYEDTLAWLNAMVPHAFEKGATKDAVPAAKSSVTVPIRMAIVNSVFAWAKQPRAGEVFIPGRGKVNVTEADLLPPTLQYGLGGGEGVDLSALMALQSLSLDFTTEGSEGQALEELAQRQQDWAHGENAVQEFEAELRDLGIDAGSLEEAAQLLVHEEGQTELLTRIQARQSGFIRELTRNYGSFKAVPTAEADVDRRAGFKPLPVSPHLKSATVVLGNWDSLNVPRQLKAEAFDRLVDLFGAQFQQFKPATVAGDIDDLIGKAAIMAAKALGIKTVAVSLAAYDFAPAQVQAPFFAVKPKARAVAEAEMAESLVLTATNLLVLGQSHRVEIATAVFTRARRVGKSLKALDTAWAKHNGLY